MAFISNAKYSNRLVLKTLITQSIPLVLSQLITTAASHFDLILLGHVGAARTMASFCVSWNIFTTVQIGFTGILIALIPAISSAYGSSRKGLMAKIVQQGMWLALLLSIPVCLLLLFPAPFLRFGGQEGAAAAEVRGYLRWLALSVPPMLLFRVVIAYASAILSTRSLLKINLVALLVKLPLSILLICGAPGLNGMGLFGSALSTVIAAWLSLAMGLRFMIADRHLSDCAGFKNWFWPRFSEQKKLLRQGLPIGASFFFDYSVITLIGLLIARGGQTQAAAHGIAANIAYLCYLLPMSFSSIATALVGHELGRSDVEGAAYTSKVVVIFSVITGGTIALLLALASPWIARIYTSDITIATYAARLITVMALYHLFDALFTVCNGVLRAFDRTLVPMLILGGAMWGIGLGGGLLFNHYAGTAQTALTYWWTLVAAAVIVAIGLYAYQRQVLRQAVGQT